MLRKNPNTRDPAGQGRERRVDVSRVGGSHTEGKVSWGSYGNAAHYGNVEIRTSNSQAAITV